MSNKNEFYIKTLENKSKPKKFIAKLYSLVNVSYLFKLNSLHFSAKHGNNHFVFLMINDLLEC